MRGTFANIRIRNMLAPGMEGGDTLHMPDGEQMSIYDAAMSTKQTACRSSSSPARNTAPAHPRLGGQGHAAAGREGGDRRELRAHPPLQPGRHGRPAAARIRTARTHQSPGARREGDLRNRGIDGGISAAAWTSLGDDHAGPTADASTISAARAGSTPLDEVDYYRHGGILHYVLRQLLAQSAPAGARRVSAMTAQSGLSNFTSSDFYAWTQAQAKELRRFARTRPNLPLDLAHLAEEIEDLGMSERECGRSASSGRSCSIFC